MPGIIPVGRLYSPVGLVAIVRFSFNREVAPGKQFQPFLSMEVS